MRFTVDVEDFWLEEEELTDALQSHIKNSVVRKISESIDEKVTKEITKKITETIQQKLSLVIDAKLADLIATGTIKTSRNGDEISIEQHVKDLFQDRSGWGTPDAKIEKIAKAFGEELKLQYNNAFANKIVQNMRKQGFLKDDIALMLTDKE